MQPPSKPTPKTLTTSNNSSGSGSGGGHQRAGPSTTTQACAACKYQRRKCVADCILAPYFPHDRQRQFLNAHHLFGVRNIVKIVRRLDPATRHHAMRTIIFQSDARAADPVGGCLRIIRHLERSLALASSELDLLLHHLAICRAAAINHHTPPPPLQRSDEEPPLLVDDANSSWSTGMHRSGAANDNGNNNINSSVVNNNDNGGADEPATSTSLFPGHHLFDINDEHQHNRVRGLSMEDCEQMRSILDNLSGPDDDRANEDFKRDEHGDILSSNNGILREESGSFKDDEDGTFSYIDDLKAAATFFTLTNCDV